MTYEDIDKSIEDVRAFLRKRKLSEGNVIRTCLSVEQTLTAFHDKFGDDGAVTVEMKKGFLRPSIVINAIGDWFNPLETSPDDEYAEFSGLLQNTDVTPTFSNHNRCNTVVYKLPHRKVGDIERIVIAILLSAVIGVLLKSTLTAPQLASLEGNVLNPICEIFLGLLSAVAIPLIFFSVVKACMNSDEMGQIGKLLAVNVLGVNVFALLLFTVTALVAFHIMPIDASLASKNAPSSMGKFFEMFFPTNAVETFADGKTAQVLFMAVVTGFGLLSMKDRMKTVIELVEQINELMMLFMSWVAKLLPLFIFAQLMQLIVAGKFSMLLKFREMIIVYYITGFALYLLLTYVVCFRTKHPWLSFLRKTGRVFLVGVSTMSSIITIPTMLSCGIKRLGIEQKCCEVLTPTVVTVNKVMDIGSMVFVSLCGVYMYDISVSWTAMVTFVVLVFLMSIAAPSVPGGVIATLTILFDVLNVPLSYVGLAAMIIPFMEFDTGVETVVTQSEIYLLAKKMNKVDTEHTE